MDSKTEQQLRQELAGLWALLDAEPYGHAALRKDAERYRKLCEVPGALDAFTAAYHNTQTKEQIDAAMDEVPAVG